VILPGENQLTVNWEECGGASSYEVYISTSTTPLPSTPVATSEKTNAVIMNLDNDTIYYIWVRAVNSAGKSYYSPVEAGIPSLPSAAPTAPDKPVLTAGSRELTVVWQAAELASAYEVWLGTSDNLAEAQKFGGDYIGVMEAIITGLVNETTYYVWIKAKNSIGESGFSPSANTKPSVFAALPVTPDTPTVVTGNRELAVSWQEVEGALFYEVWMGTTYNSADAEKNGEDLSDTSVTLADLINGTTYYVWVKAKNDIGTSGFSPMASGVPMAALGGLTVSASNQQIIVSWASVSGATSYEVYHSTSTTIPAEPSATATTLNHTFTSLDNGTTYYFWVKAVNANGTSAESMASGKPIGNIGAVTLTPGNNQLTASWSTVAGADEYEVYHNTSYSIPVTPTQTVSTATATISDLINGTTYYVWVKPKNVNGMGAVSAVANGMPLAAPGDLTVSASNQWITISWAYVPGATSYQVYYSTTTTIPDSPSATVTTLNRAFSSLTNGTMYYFWVKAVNAYGTSASPMASGKPIGDMGAVTVTTGGSGKLVLSWSTVAGADEYEVYHNTSYSIPASPTQTVSTTTATIGDLNNGTTYYVWVKPKNANGTGGTSAAVNGIPMATLEDLTISAANQEITVSWASVSGATTYQVFYNTNSTIPASSSFTVTTTSRTITGLTNGITYYFWVKAVNASTTSASPMASGKPIGNMVAVTLTSGNGQLSISWPTVAGADQYEVYHNTSNSIPASPTQTVSTATAIISDLTNGATYYVWVKPKNTNGTGGTSAATSGKPLGTPGAPTVTTEYKALQVTWTAVPGADEYEVYYGTGTSTTLATTTTGTMAIITGLTSGITYNVRLRAKNSTGSSDYGPSANGLPDNVRRPGLYRGDDKIGNQNLVSSISYISANAVTGDNYLIILGADESVSPMYFYFSSKTVGVTLLGYGSERTITLSSNGSMFTVDYGITLTLEENIKLIGSNTNNASLVLVNSGGNFIMNGGTISGNNTENFGGYSGGGVNVGSHGTFTMNGGTISENTPSGQNGYSGFGGGVHVDSYGTFTMTSGTISGNTADRGGGVYLDYLGAGGTFTMTGGEISGNTGRNGGGGVHCDNGIFRIVTGTIYGSDEGSLSNSSALHGPAQCGTFNGETWVNMGSLSTTDNTIRVINGELQ